MTHPGPTHPGPSGPTQPSPRSGHLPIAAAGWVDELLVDTPKAPPNPHYECDTAAAVACPTGEHSNSDPREARRAIGPASAVAVVAAGVGHLPRLGELIRDAERLGAQLLAVLRRDYDPASAPSVADDPLSVGYVDIRLMCAMADVRSALLMLGQIVELGLPPAGSAVKYSARQSPPEFPSPGGPSNHPDHIPGERRSPGYDADLGGAASESVGFANPAQATSSPVHVPGEGRTSGLVTAAPVAVDGSLGGSAAPGAGASSGTRPVASGPGAGHEPDRPTSPGLPPRPGVEDEPCYCLMCGPRRSSWSDYPTLPAGRQSASDPAPISARFLNSAAVTGRLR